MTLTFIILSIFIGVWIYYFPMQRATAVEAVNAYMKKQGISQKLITSERVFKDFKQNGYFVDVTLKDDPKIGYEYSYS